MLYAESLVTINNQNSIYDSALSPGMLAIFLMQRVVKGRPGAGFV